MTLDEFKASISADQSETLKAIVQKTTDITSAEAKIFISYIQQSADALGEDQIAEPLRYIATSTSGLRSFDLQALVGSDFNAETFETWVMVLGFPILLIRELPGNRLYDLSPALHNFMRQEMGDSLFHSCASDIGFYLLENREAGDPVRDVQITHLLLDGNQSAAAAEYISQTEGQPLQFALQTLGQALKDGPDYVKQAVYDMPLTLGENVNTSKLLSILFNDCIAFLAQPDLQLTALQKLLNLVQTLLGQGQQQFSVFMGIAKLRLAQNARVRKEEKEAQEHFIAALNHILPLLQQANPLEQSAEQIRLYWNCLKICQEMGQPKAITLLFEAIIKVEQAQAQDTNRPDAERAQVAEHMLNQHIDMSKLYYAFPEPLRADFTNYTESTIVLLKAYLEGVGEDKDETDTINQSKMAGYYQSLGELCDHLDRHEEAYDALVEAQILQMRQLGMLQKRDGEKMSPEQLLQRLGLSVTNHMLASHYRFNKKSAHDLKVALTSNMDLALDCFRTYPRDPRVIHFAINAALELGNQQHNEGGLMAECSTYVKIISQFPVLNNMRLDTQLVQDLAMIHTKCGQVQADAKIRRITDAVRNLQMALKLWQSLAQNTKNPDYQKNAETVQKLLNQIKR